MYHHSAENKTAVVAEEALLCVLTYLPATAVRTVLKVRFYCYRLEMRALYVMNIS